MLTACVSNGSSHPGLTSPPPATQDLAGTLRSLLPAGRLVASKVVTPTQVTGTSQQSSIATVVFDDGVGPAEITVSVFILPVPLPAVLTQCPDAAYHPYSACTSRTLSDGRLLALDKSPVDDAKPTGVQRWTAQLTSPRGQAIALSEVNSRERTDANRTRLAPPLPVDQLATIATSKAWSPFLDQLATPTFTPTKHSDSPASAAHITSTLAALLPPKLRIADPGGSDGFGHVTVDDGGGKSLVSVNVQVWPANDPGIKQLFAAAPRLPDGTRVLIRQGPSDHGGKGTVEWTFDSFRTSGLRVVISSLNAHAYGLAAGRRTPVLTMADLRRIALDPSWKELASR